MYIQLPTFADGVCLGKIIYVGFKAEGCVIKNVLYVLIGLCGKCMQFFVSIFQYLFCPCDNFPHNFHVDEKPIKNYISQTLKYEITHSFMML